MHSFALYTTYTSLSHLALLLYYSSAGGLILLLSVCCLLNVSYHMRLDYYPMLPIIRDASNSARWRESAEKCPLPSRLPTEGKF